MLIGKPNESFGVGGREQVGVGGVGRALRSPGGRLLHRHPRTETGDSAETRYGAQVTIQFDQNSFLKRSQFIKT